MRLLVRTVEGVGLGATMRGANTFAETLIVDCRADPASAWLRDRGHAGDLLYRARRTLHK